MLNYKLLCPTDILKLVYYFSKHGNGIVFKSINETTVGGLRIHLLFVVCAYFNYDKLYCYELDYIFMGVPPKYQNRYRYRKSMGFIGLAQPIPLMLSHSEASNNRGINGSRGRRAAKAFHSLITRNSWSVSAQSP